MENPKTPSPEELILAMLRQVLANQAQAMGLNAPPTQTPATDTRTEQAAPHRPSETPAESFSRATTTPVAATPPTPGSSERRGGTGTAPVFAPLRDEPPATRTHTPARREKSEAEEPEEKLSAAQLEELDEYAKLAAQPLAPSHMARTLKWIAAIVVGLIVFVNLPLLNGLALARALPDQQALIIRDGLVLKGSGDKIYVLQDNRKRWISSLQLFEREFRWQDVHVVDDVFLAQFPDGRPLYLLLKCDSPHVYRIEDGKKRWIRDIPTFLSEGHVWDEVKHTSCAALKQIPDGVPIPPDAGTPPTP